MLLSHEFPTNRSLAGSWGETRLPPEGRKITSLARESFSEDMILRDKLVRQTSLAKYRHLKDSSPMLLSYGSKGAPDGLINARDMNKSDDDRVSFETESSLIMGTGLRYKNLNLSKSQAVLSRAPTAPIALGRSGRRIERGVSTTGLSGEKLFLTQNLGRNTLIQRTWMYQGDPALKYKIEGIPASFAPKEVTLTIGEVEGQGLIVPPGANFRRKQQITATPLSRGVPCGKIFMDFQSDEFHRPL